jgi:hypothetical protein
MSLFNATQNKLINNIDARKSKELFQLTLQAKNLNIL